MVDTKKEGGLSLPEIEKKYGLDKLEKNEFIKQISKELRKYEEKLARAAKYEVMQKQGETLDQEVLNFVSQKPDYENNLKALKTTVNIYIKAAQKPGEAAPVSKDPKVEIQDRIHDYAHSAARRLAYFLAMGASVADKERLNPQPLAHLPAEQQAEIAKLFAEMLHAPTDKETSLFEEAERLSALLLHIMEANEGVAKVVEGVINNSATGTIRYKLAAPKVPQPNQYAQSEPLSVGKGLPVPEPKKEPAPAPVPVVEKPAEPKKEEPKPVEPVKEPEKPSQWAEQEVEEEEAPAQAAKPQEEAKEYVVPQPGEEEEEEDEFTIVGDDKKRPTGRGRYGRGRRRGGYRYRGEGRGDFGGRRPYRGRGEGRGEARGPRGAHQ